MQVSENQNQKLTHLFLHTKHIKLPFADEASNNNHLIVTSHRETEAIPIDEILKCTSWCNHPKGVMARDVHTAYSWPRVILVAMHQLLMEVKLVDQAPKCARTLMAMRAVVIWLGKVAALSSHAKVPWFVIASAFQTDLI